MSEELRSKNELQLLQDRSQAAVELAKLRSLFNKVIIYFTVVLMGMIGVLIWLNVQINSAKSQSQINREIGYGNRLVNCQLIHLSNPNDPVAAQFCNIPLDQAK